MFARLIATGLLILAVCGCQSTPTQPRAGSSAGVEAGSGDSIEALRARALAAGPARGAWLLVQVAQRELDSGDWRAASATLESVRPELLDELQQADYGLARAEVLYHLGDRRAANAALAEVDPALLHDPTRWLLTSALIGSGNDPLVDAEALMALRPDPAAAQRVNDLIWLSLARVPALRLLALRTSVRGDELGWIELKVQTLQSLTIAEQTRRLADWQARWPDHPANQLPPRPLQTLLAGSTGPATLPAQPRRLGLLLPLNGPLGRAGRAVRDGFLATYLEHARDLPFEVHVYDTTQQPLPELYERTLTDGMDLLVGPLRKEAVAELNGLQPDVPVLALNYLEPGVPAAPGLRQLGLAIEDEARTIAERLSADGRRNVLVLHDPEEWAGRALRQLYASWRDADDLRVTDQLLLDVRTVTESVGNAMLVSKSEERRSELERVLGETLEFLPRARGDIDAIVALVSNVEANALVPALRYHFADQLPVYASSQSVRGAAPSALSALSGFQICEIPGFVIGDGSYASLAAAFSLDGNPLASLYALGVDALRVGNQLPLLLAGNVDQLLGSTGVLSVAGDGQLRRELTWAVVRDGRLSAATAPALGR